MTLPYISNRSTKMSCSICKKKCEITITVDRPQKHKGGHNWSTVCQSCFFDLLKKPDPTRYFYADLYALFRKGLLQPQEN